MPVFKHIAAQQKKQAKADALRAQKRRRGEDDQGLATSTQVAWSDEDSDSEDNDDEDEEEDSEASGSDEEGSDEEEEEDEVEDEEMEAGSGEEDESDEELVMDANDPTKPRRPPPGLPNAVEALSDPVVSSAAIAPADEESSDEADGAEKKEDEEELPLICVICPNKVLKKGKMVQVHLSSKDHLRRLARFRTHLESSDCPEAHKTADARWVSSELDRLVFERLSRQTEVGGKKAGTAPAEKKKEEGAAAKGKGKQPAAATEEVAPARPLKRKADAVSKAETDGTSVREQLRLQKKERFARRKEAKREKVMRMKAKKAQEGEAGEDDKETPAIKMAAPPKSHATKPKRRFIEKAKPSAEEIKIRQDWKEARRKARAAGLAEPPKPILAYEYGGDLSKVPKAVQNRHDKLQAAYERGDKAPSKAAPEAKEKADKGARSDKKSSPTKKAGGAAPASGPGSKAAKRKEKKERRKSAEAGGELLPEV